MADLTIADLVPSPSRDDVQAVLLASTGRSEFPITDWHSGGVWRTLLEIETEVIEDLVGQTIPTVIAEGFVEFADGDWLGALAHAQYGIDRAPATIASQTLTLACSAAAGPYALVSGRVFFTATDGKRYVLGTTGTLSTGGTLAVRATAESPGAALGLVNALDKASPLAGVTIVPGSPAIEIISTVSQFGSNSETDVSLISRCLARWPSLTAVLTQDRTVKWALAGSTEVTRTRLDADPANAGGVIVTLAGPSGGVTSTAVNDVQFYIDARAAITDWITAQAATELTITASGTVTVPSALADEIQAAADAAWVAYLASAQIGGVVFVARLIQAVMDAGAIDFTGATLNSGLDVALASTEVPLPDAAGLATLLVWVLV